MSELPNYFEIEWHENTVIVSPSAGIEELSWDVVERAADVIMQPLEDQQAPDVIVDLSKVNYFGSIFLALLLRCHKFVRRKSGELVLCGANKLALDLLESPPWIQSGPSTTTDRKPFRLCPEIPLFGMLQTAAQFVTANAGTRGGRSGSTDQAAQNPH